MKKVTILTALTISLFLIGCEEEGDSVVHHQGQNCMECHSFNSGATIYSDLRGKDNTSEGTAKGYSMQLVLENHTVIQYRSARGYGNVRWSGDTGAIDNFTVQVIDTQGKVVNTSSSNSHNVGRLACNTCHTQNGLNGAPGRIVNYPLNNTLSNNVKK